MRIAGRTLDFYAEGQAIDRIGGHRRNRAARLNVPAGYCGGKQPFEVRFAGDYQYGNAPANGVIAVYASREVASEAKTTMLSR